MSSEAHRRQVDSAQDSLQQMQLDRSDTLYSIRLWLLERLNIAPKPIAWQKLDLLDAAVAARVLCLRQAEVQQLQGSQDLKQPINPRNEAAALALLVAHQSAVCRSSLQRQQQLQELVAAYYYGSIQQQGQLSNTAADAGAPGAAYGPESPEQQLYSWVVFHGAAVQLTAAAFPIPSSSSSEATTAAAKQQKTDNPAAAAEEEKCTPHLRGCAAASDLPAGCSVISIPSSLLLTYKTAAETDFGRVLTKIGLDPETLAVVWTMVERWDEESIARPFWKALPERFDTGLSAPEPLVDLLKGTPLHQEMISARQHVKQQFTNLQQSFKVLLTAYPSYLQESWFSEQNYLWAVELWYAYAIQVKFPDGSIQPALAPFVSLINHNPWPHIVHFSTVDPETKQLNLTTFRSVQQQQQVYLSYGPLPNSQLLLFYGFTVEQNPFEEAELVIDLQQVVQQQQQQQQGVAAAAAVADVALRLRVLQEVGLGLQYRLTVQQPAPPGLLECLRVLCCSTAELQAVQNAVQQAKQASSSTAAAAAATTADASGDAKAAGKKGKAITKGSSSSSSKAKSSSSSSSNELEERWAAAAVRSQVLGQPLSTASEAAVQKALGNLLEKAKAPFESCSTKIARRKQLQALLQQKQQEQQGASSSSSSSSDKDGFMACMEGFLKGIIELYDACARGCGL